VKTVALTALALMEAEAGVPDRQWAAAEFKDALPPLRGGSTYCVVQLLGWRSQTTVSGTADQRIAAVAARQRGRISRLQLVAVSVGPNTIDRLARRGYLIRQHRAVYAVGHLGPIPLANETAALLALRAGALLSHETSARMWGMLPAGSGDGQIHVIVPGSSPGASLNGVVTHRSAALEPWDLRMRDGLPVTSAARALLDMAPTQTTRALESALGQALYLRLIRQRDLEPLRRRCADRRRCARLTALISSWEEPAMTRSEAEDLFLSLVRRAELPEPKVNMDWQKRERDFRWPESRLIVEIDGWAGHGLRPAFESDRRRDARALAVGSSTMRITWRQLRDDSLAVIASVASALAHGSYRPSAAEA
jgi:very-short-patch-repair endonuclease